MVKRKPLLSHKYSELLYFLYKGVLGHIRHRPDDRRKNQNENNFHYIDVYVCVCSVI